MKMSSSDNVNAVVTARTMRANYFSRTIGRLIGTDEKPMNPLMMRGLDRS